MCTRNNDVNKFATRYNIIVVGDLKPRASKKKKKYYIPSINIIFYFMPKETRPCTTNTRLYNIIILNGKYLKCDFDICIMYILVL